MSVSDKLLISKFFVGLIAIVFLIISYAVITTHSNEINDEVSRALNDSFGHLKGELANL